MKFSKLFAAFLICSTSYAAHVRDRSIYVTDIVDLANASIFKFPTVAPTASRACMVNSDGEVTSSSVTSTELGYVSGVTSAIQTQLDAKLAGPLTGDVTTSGSVATIANLAVTNAKIANSTIDLTAKVTGALPVANAGQGLSGAQTIISSTSGTQNDVAVATTFLNFTGNAPKTITGFVAKADGTEITVKNSDSNLADSFIIANNSSSSSSANRILTRGGANIGLTGDQTVKFRYSGTNSKWLQVSPSIAVSSPMSVSTGDSIVLPLATNVQDGYLSSADWSTFNSKIGGSGTAARVPVFITGNNLSSQAGFEYDSVNQSLGVQVPVASMTAALNVKSDVGTTISGPGSITAVLHQFVLPAVPDSCAAATATPYMAVPTGGSATINYGSGNCIADGTTRDYRIFQGSIASGNKWAKIGEASFSNGGDDSSANSYTTAVTWSPNYSSAVTPDVWRVYRQTNGGGFTEYQDTSSTSSFDDVCDGSWVAGSPDPTPPFDDLVAVGGSYSFDSYSSKTSPIGSTIYSASAAPGCSYNDPNDGLPYRITLTINTSGPETSFRTLVNTSNHIDTLASDTVDSANVLSGNTVTPTTFGLLSDNHNLNLSFVGFRRQASPLLYSPSSSGPTVTGDPNDGNYYYVTVNQGTPYGPDQPKILAAIDGGSYDYGVIDNNFDYYGPSSMPDGPTVTPNTRYVGGAIIESHGTSSTDPATLALKSLDGGYSRLDFTTSADLLRGYIENNGQSLTMGTGGSPYINMNSSSGNTVVSVSGTGSLSSSNTARVSWGSAGTTFAGSLTGNNSSTTLDVTGTGTLSYSSTNRMRWNTNGLGFYTATPVSQAGSSANIDSTIDNVGLRASGATTAPFGNTIVPRTGSASSGTAPIKLVSGSLMTTPEAGALEFLSDKFYSTITTGPARKEVALIESSAGSGSIYYATTNDRLTSSGNVQVTGGNTVTATNLVGSLAITNSSLTSGRVIFSGASGVEQDDSDMTFSTDMLTVTKLSAGGGRVYAGGSPAYIGGRLNHSTTQATSSGTAATDLHTYTIAANTFNDNGDTIKWRSSGTFVASSPTKKIQVSFGGTTILDTGAIAVTAGANWVESGECIRVSSNNQKCNVTFDSSDAGLSSFAQYTATTSADGGTIIVKTVGTEGGAGGTDITEETWHVDYEAATF